MTDQRNLNAMKEGLRQTLKEGLNDPFGDILLEMICRLAVENPAFLRLFQRAFVMRGEWMREQAAGLDAIADLKRITEGQ